jgi:hypothetical protein
VGGWIFALVPEELISIFGDHFPGILYLNDGWSLLALYAVVLPAVVGSVFIFLVQQFGGRELSGIQAALATFAVAIVCWTALVSYFLFAHLTTVRAVTSFAALSGLFLGSAAAAISVGYFHTLISIADSDPRRSLRMLAWAFGCLAAEGLYLVFSFFTAV